MVALVHDADYEKSDFGGRGTEMVIIDAQKFEEGPVARLRMPTYGRDASPQTLESTPCGVVLRDS
jgi:hypothetical protein